MSFPCPYKDDPGRKTKHCARDAESIRGWKTHMSRQHGGYDEGQLGAIVGAAVPNPDAGRITFLGEIDSTDTPGLFDPDREKTGQDTPTEGNAVGVAGATRTAPEQPKKRVKFKPKAMREFLSELPEMFFKAKGIEPDDSDKKLLDAASEMLEELFGVSFEVPDTEWVIKSRLLALLFPFAAVLVVYAKHTITLDWFKKKDEQQETETQQAAD